MAKLCLRIVSCGVQGARCSSHGPFFHNALPTKLFHNTQIFDVRLPATADPCSASVSLMNLTASTFIFSE